MRKLISFMHMSLDGYVASTSGSLNWVTLNEDVFSHIEARIITTDTALYGRTTYNMMEAYWPEADKKPNAGKHDREHAAWYRSANKVVVSNTLTDVTDLKRRVFGQDCKLQIQELKQSEGSDILIFGSPTVTHALMQLGEVDGYWLFIHPVVLGAGTSLFAGQGLQQILELQHAGSFSCGVTELSYLVVKE